MMVSLHSQLSPRIMSTILNTCAPRGLWLRGEADAVPRPRPRAHCDLTSSQSTDPRPHTRGDPWRMCIGTDPGDTRDGGGHGAPLTPQPASFEASQDHF